MLMFWDALREAARRRQNKKSNIPSPNDCFSAKKNKNGILFRRQKKNIYRKERKKTYQKRFLSKFCYCSEIANSYVLRIFCICFFIFSYRGRLEHNNPAVCWTHLNFCIFESLSKFRKSNQIFGVEPLKYGVEYWALLLIWFTNSFALHSPGSHSWLWIPFVSMTLSFLVFKIAGHLTL